MLKWGSFARVGLFLCLVTAAVTARGAVVSWHIVSSVSSVTLTIPNSTLTLTSTGGITGSAVTSATVTFRILNPGTGTTSTPTAWTIGNKQYLEGSLNSITDFSSSIQFLAPSSYIRGIDSGSYQPLADGSAGITLGGFGMRVFGGFQSIFGTFNADVAIRNAMYALTSSSLPVDGLGQFPLNSGLQFGLDSADVAHRTRNVGGLFGSYFLGNLSSGAASLSSQVTSNNATSGLVIGSPSWGQLTIPINVPVQISLDADGMYMLNGNLTGSIYAVCMPEPSTYAMLAIGLAMLGPTLLRRRWSTKPRDNLSEGLGYDPPSAIP